MKEEKEKEKKKTDTAHQNNKDHKLQVRSRIQSIINKKEWNGGGGAGGGVQ